MNELRLEVVPAVEWPLLSPFIFERNHAAGEVRCLHSHTADDAGGCAAELRALAAEEGRYVAARAAGALLGVIGAEFDLALGRAWLRGPLVAAGQDFETVGGALLEALDAALPAPITQHAAFVAAGCDEALAFFRRRGFGDEARVDELEITSAPSPRPLPPGLRLALPEAAWREAIGALHEAEFPSTWLSVAQLFAAPEPDRFTRIALVGDVPCGYVRARCEPHSGQGHVDFLAVAEAARRSGAGRALLLAALDWIFAGKGLRSAFLTVQAHRDPARRLYAAVGFVTARAAIGLRRTSRAGPVALR
jgi:ribosomal protein S18 acetylase RimI-like enzyme